LQVAFGWDDEHLNRFETRGREYAVYRDGGGMIGIDAKGVRLGDLPLRRLERFVYEYDFGHSWIHDLRLEANRWRGSRASSVMSAMPTSSLDALDLRIIAELQNDGRRATVSSNKPS
jgi:hypothetical protein